MKVMAGGRCMDLPGKSEPNIVQDSVGRKQGNRNLYRYTIPV